MEGAHKEPGRRTPSLAERLTSLSTTTKALAGAVVAVIAAIVAVIGFFHHPPATASLDFRVRPGTMAFRNYAILYESDQLAAKGGVGDMRLAANTLAQGDSDLSGGETDAGPSTTIGTETDTTGPVTGTTGTDTTTTETDTTTGPETDTTTGPATDTTTSPPPGGQPAAVADAPLDGHEQAQLDKAVHHAQRAARAGRVRFDGCRSRRGFDARSCAGRFWAHQVGWRSANGRPLAVSPLEAARRLLKILRGTRTQAVPGHGLQPVGRLVNFTLATAHCEGHTLTVRWTLYPGNGGGQLPDDDDWVKDQYAVWVEPHSSPKRVRTYFWVPQPKTRGPLLLHVSVYDADGELYSPRDLRIF
jgi:hypothetical protein